MISLARHVWQQYNEGLAFKNAIGLFETVEENENFFIGRQWEGVQAKGLPTPVFNFLKRVVLFLVASITSDDVRVQASPMGLTSSRSENSLITAQAVNRALETAFERNALPQLLREYMLSAAVCGDGCLYTHFDPDYETGEREKGEICSEVIPNTRVFFGNPNSRDVQSQPYIIISSRRFCSELSKRSGENIRPDEPEGYAPTTEPGERATLLLRLRRGDNGNIFACECTRQCIIRDEWDTGLKLYPITWICWDNVPDSCHGMAAVTGLIPNQIFVNKLFAMAMLSLMTTAYPKVIYDRTRVPKWDNRVGAAIGVLGDVSGAAQIIDPAAVSPQISQFIGLAVDYTQNFLGATDTAMGNVRPDNTSAIIAVQRASNIPLEMVKQGLYRSVEELSHIYIDNMRAYYGLRVAQGNSGELFDFDFSNLKSSPLQLKIDVGAGSYWSEIACVQTLDNLLQAGKISLEDYLTRLPDGFISHKAELIEKAGERQVAENVPQ